MAFVRVEQRNAHLAGTVRLDWVNGRDGKLARLTRDKWIEGMEARNLKEPPPKAAPDAPRETTAKFVAVEIAGTAATCKVEIWRGGKQLFTDFLALYQFADGWKIVSKTFYRHP